MATLPLWALANGASWASREDSPQRHKGHKEKRTTKDNPWCRVIIFLRMSSLCLLCVLRALCGEFSYRIFLPQFIQEAFTVGRHVPGVRPKAQIDAPPIVRHAGFEQLGQQFIKVQLAGAEGI